MQHVTIKTKSSMVAIMRLSLAESLSHSYADLMMFSSLVRYDCARSVACHKGVRDTVSKQGKQDDYSQAGVMKDGL